MNIDVEGFDEAVVRSLDFSKYRPEVLIVEMIGTDIEEALASDLYRYLREKNYRAHAKTGNSVMLTDRNARS